MFSFYLLRRVNDTVALLWGYWLVGLGILLFACFKGVLTEEIEVLRYILMSR